MLSHQGVELFERIRKIRRGGLVEEVCHWECAQRCQRLQPGFPRCKSWCVWRKCPLQLSPPDVYGLRLLPQQRLRLPRSADSASLFSCVQSPHLPVQLYIIKVLSFQGSLFIWESSSPSPSFPVHVPVYLLFFHFLVTTWVSESWYPSHARMHGFLVSR